MANPSNSSSAAAAAAAAVAGSAAATPFGAVNLPSILKLASVQSCAKCGRTSGSSSSSSDANVKQAGKGEKSKSPHDSVSLKRCSACRKVFYCSPECQRADSHRHKSQCVQSVTEQNAAKAAAARAADTARLRAGRLYIWGSGENGMLGGAAGGGPPILARAVSTNTAIATHAATAELNAAIATTPALIETATPTPAAAVPIASASAASATTSVPATMSTAAPMDDGDTKHSLAPTPVITTTPIVTATTTELITAAAAAISAAPPSLITQVSAVNPDDAATAAATAAAAAAVAAAVANTTAPPATPIPSLSLSVPTSQFSDAIRKPNTAAPAAAANGSTAAAADAPYEDALIPTAVPTLKSIPIASAAAGVTHALAITADGQLFSWGASESGETGHGDRRVRSRPALVTALEMKVITSAAVGLSHSVATTAEGDVVAWGSNEFGQLGTNIRPPPNASGDSKGFDFGEKLFPAVVKQLRGIRIVSVACGDRHTIFLDDTGRMYGCGDASKGQLGFGPSVTKRVPIPSLIESIARVPMARIAAGAQHSLSLSATGAVYSWGESRRGQLGQPAPSASASAAAAPVQLNASGGTRSAGSRMARLAPDAASASTTKVDTPRRVEWFFQQNITIVQIAARASYSAAISSDAHLFTFGHNDSGQLGTANLESYYLPQRNALTNVTAVACGLTHSLVIADGVLYASGSNASGELGIGFPLEPKKSFTPVTIPEAALTSAPGTKSLTAPPRLLSITAGAGVTSAIVYAPSGTAPSTPASVTHSAIAGSSGTALALVPLATASGSAAAPQTPARDEKSDTITAVVATPSRRALRPLPRAPLWLPRPVLPAAFDYDRISGLLRLASASGDSSVVAKALHQIFSSPSLLNASFLPTHGTGVDAYTLERFYKLLLRMSTQTADLVSVLVNAIQKLLHDNQTHLRTATPSSDESAFRFLAIVLACPLLSRDSQRERLLLVDICQAVRRIPPAARAHLLRTFAEFPPELFGSRLVKMLVRQLSTALQQSRATLVSTWQNAVYQRQVAAMQNPLLLAQESPLPKEAPKISDVSDDIVAGVELLHLLYRANDINKRGFTTGATAVGAAPVRSGASKRLVPDSNFYLSAMHDSVDLKADLVRYLQPPPANSAQLPDFSFCRFAFVLSPLSKSHYLRMESSILQHHNAVRSVMSNDVPFLMLKVRREAIVDDVIFQLSAASPSELRRPLKVEFLDEAGIDAGGLTTEFFTLVSRQMVARFDLFQYSTEMRTLWYASTGTEPPTKQKLQLTRLFGILVGLATFHSVAIGLNFPTVFFRKLLGETSTLDDLALMDPILGKSLQQLLDFEGDVENTFNLNFDVTEVVPVTPTATTAAAKDSKSDSKSTAAAAPAPAPATKYVTRELMKGGSSIAVTNENRAKYVDLYIDWRLHGGVKAQSDAFVSGFKAACDGHSLSLFTASELELLICGLVPSGAWKELEGSVTYEGGYTAQSPVIKHFWSVVHNDLTPDQRLALLTFVTGSSRMPLGGMRELKMIIQRAGPDSATLPTSSTCFHVLLLPEYPTKEKVLSKLLLALAHGSEGFGLH